MSRENWRELLFEEITTHDFPSSFPTNPQTWETQWIQARIIKFSVENSINKNIYFNHQDITFSFHRM